MKHPTKQHIHPIFEQSHQLQKQLPTFFRNQTYPIPSPVLSHSSLRYIKHIYSELLHTKRHWKDFLISVADMESKYFSTEYTENVFHNITYSKIEPIKTEIQKQIQEGIHAQLAFGSRTVNVYFLFPSWMRERIHKYQNQYLMRMIMWLNWAFKSASDDCSEVLDVYLFLTDLTKQLPDISHKPLDQDNVNTAYTTSCTRHTKIILYRYEEWFKVFLHETMHCLGLDFSSMDGQKYDQQILSLFRGCDPKTEVSLTETYSEIWAEIVNILCCVLCERENHHTRAQARAHVHTPRQLRKTKTRKTISKSPERWNKIVQNIQHRLWMEQRFSVFQCSKILSHYGITYEQLCSGESDIRYIEQTPVLAYYIIKTILMMNVDMFIEWCKMHNRPYPLKMTLKETVLNSFVSMIRKKYLKDEWLKTIQSAQHALRNFSPKSEWIKKTLRMTINECI
jgi:hypothetical protein